jgi:hypothetical protein
MTPCSLLNTYHLLEVNFCHHLRGSIARSRQQVFRYIGVSTKLYGVTREMTVIQRSLYFVKRNENPSKDSAAKRAVPTVSYGFLNKLNPLEVKGDSSNQNLQRAPLYFVPDYSSVIGYKVISSGISRERCKGTPCI